MEAAHVSINVKKVRLGPWLLVGGLVALLVLLVGYKFAIQHVQPDTVQISQYVDATGHVLAERTITDPRTVADYYARINSIPQVPPNESFNACTLFDRDTVTDYSVIFTYRGIDVEDATLTQFGCPMWSINHGNLPGPQIYYFDAADVAKPILAQAQP
jgi:hypothetical protein